MIIYLTDFKNVRFNIICKSKLEHKVFILFIFFCPTDQPTIARDGGDGKRNILLAWPYEKAGDCKRTVLRKRKTFRLHQ